MNSPISRIVIGEALRNGRALLKFISPNDAGATGGHQAGFYLPKSVAGVFTPFAPVIGENRTHEVKIEWQNGQIVTDSVVTWYGRGTRAEYRLTRFGQGFEFLNTESIGNLLVLIPENLDFFRGYVIDHEDDIEEIISVLGVQPFDRPVIFGSDTTDEERVDECLETKFQEFASTLQDFPSGAIFSDKARSILELCRENLVSLSPDDKLLEFCATEYRLFQIVEQQLCQPEISRNFKDVNEFVQTANSITNRRRARAGRSLENHVGHILSEAGLPHEAQPNIAGRPDIIIPSADAYDDLSYPTDKLFILGVKTTCKDRWRQVLNEGTRVTDKHILTLQPGISVNQLTEMHSANVQLVVPHKTQKVFPEGHPMTILTLEDFISSVGETLAGT